MMFVDAWKPAAICPWLSTCWPAALRPRSSAGLLYSSKITRSYCYRLHPLPRRLIADDDAVEQARRLTRFTSPFNLAGLPALSMSCGFDSRGLPIGLHMIAGPWKDAALLQAARAYERETSWATRLPPTIGEYPAPGTLL